MLYQATWLRPPSVSRAPVRERRGSLYMAKRFPYSPVDCHISRVYCIDQPVGFLWISSKNSPPARGWTTPNAIIVPSIFKIHRRNSQKINRLVNTMSGCNSYEIILSFMRLNQFFCDYWMVFIYTFFWYLHPLKGVVFWIILKIKKICSSAFFTTSIFLFLKFFYLFSWLFYELCKNRLILSDFCGHSFHARLLVFWKLFKDFCLLRCRNKHCNYYVFILNNPK